VSAPGQQEKTGGRRSGQAARRRATERALRSVDRLDGVTGRVVTRRTKTIGLTTSGQRFRDRRAVSPAVAHIAGILKT